MLYGPVIRALLMLSPLLASWLIALLPVPKHFVGYPIPLPRSVLPFPVFWPEPQDRPHRFGLPPKAQKKLDAGHLKSQLRFDRIAL